MYSLTTLTMVNRVDSLPWSLQGYRLQIINDQLTVHMMGGQDNDTKEITNKVSTFNNNTNKWTRYYPDLMKPRHKSGVVIHEDHVIVLGGVAN